VPTLSGYSGSKHAVAGFFESLRTEIARDGVSITLVYPGFVATDIATRAVGPGGKTLGVRNVVKSRAMPVEECATRIIEASSRRRRELLMTFKGKVGQWLKLMVPGTVDRITERALERGW
jgi:short-subunit dehydrogenase